MTGHQDVTTQAGRDTRTNTAEHSDRLTFAAWPPAPQWSHSFSRSHWPWAGDGGPTIAVIEDDSQYSEQDIIDIMPGLLTYIGTTLDQQLTASPTPQAPTARPADQG